MKKISTESVQVMYWLDCSARGLIEKYEDKLSVAIGCMEDVTWVDLSMLKLIAEDTESFNQAEAIAVLSGINKNIKIEGWLRLMP